MEHKPTNLHTQSPCLLCGGVVVLIAAATILGVLICRRQFGRKHRRQVPYKRLELAQQSTESDKKISALVLGGSGSVGKALVKCLLSNGAYQVHSLDLRIPSDDALNRQVSSYIQTDITNLADLEAAFKGVDVVFHTASALPQLSVSEAEMYRINAGGTENVIAACKHNGVKRLVYTSTCNVAMTEKGSPVYPYAGSKAFAEEAVCKANGTGGLLTCALRPGMILSADNCNTPSLMTRVYYPGEFSNIQYQYAPVEAIAKAHLLAEKKLYREGRDSAAAGKAYFTCGRTITFKSFYGQMSGDTTIWGQSPPVLIPTWFLYSLAYFNIAMYSIFGTSPFGSFGNFLTPQMLRTVYSYSVYDSTPACEELGWDMDFPPLEVIAKDIIEGYKQLQQRTC